MKEIKSFVRIKHIDRIVRSLKRAGISEMSVIHVQELGHIDSTNSKISFELTSRYAEVAKLEIVCRESRMEEIINIIQTEGHTGLPGDGIIYVSPVDDAVKIRTGERGSGALA